MKRLVVLISGNGSNLQAVIDAIDAGLLAAKIVLVVSNKADAYGLQRAQKAGIATKIMPAFQPRSQYDAELADFIETYQPDLIVLAGWMRILSLTFLQRFPKKVINLHPALPGEFPGVNAIHRAWQAFQQGQIHGSGVMIHFVPDEDVDAGPVLAQQFVPMFPEDNLTTFAERMHQAEHQLLVQVLGELVRL